MPYGSRVIGFAPADRSKIVGVVHDELLAARAKYPNDSTPAGHALSTAILDGYNKWVTRGSDLVPTDETGYAKWTQEGATLVNSIRDIEGFAKEGTFSWVVKEASKQSAIDAANLLAKGGRRIIDTAGALFSWKGLLVIGAVGAGFLFFYTERRKTIEAKRR